MNLKQYLAEERGRQAALAKAIGAHAPDVSRWADGARPIPVQYGAPIERATGGLVTRQEMFPNDWESIWPELVAIPRSATGGEPFEGHDPRFLPSRKNIMEWKLPDQLPSLRKNKMIKL